MAELLPLPREIESDPCHLAVAEALRRRPRLLWAGGTVVAPVVALTAALRAALTAPETRARLRRGLEAAEAALAAEARGLASLSEADTRRQGGRVSRLLLISNDGAERFYRRVEHVVLAHASRVLACMIDADSATLGTLLYGGDAVAKLLLTERKTAAVAILRAIAMPE
jgi:hypothetical protein